MVGGADRNVRREGGGAGAIAMSDGWGAIVIFVLLMPPTIEPPLVVTNWLISFEIQGY